MTNNYTFDDIIEVAIERKKKRPHTFLKLYNSGKTLQEIGDMYGLTRERVRQLLSSLPDYSARKFNPDVAVKEWDSGKTLNQISNKMGYSKLTVYNGLKRSGIKFERKKTLDYDLIVELYNELKSAPLVAERIGCWTYSVYRILKIMEVPITRKKISRDKVILFYNKNLSVKNIANRLKCSKTSVYRILQDELKLKKKKI